MKKILFFAALVLGLASCQNDFNDFGVNVGGEQEVMVNVSLEDVTRANSGLSSFENGVLGDHDLRYILEIYNGDNCHRKVEYTTEKFASFPVRLAPGRAYDIVVWADFVKKEGIRNNDDADLYYETSAGLKNISIINGAPMTEARDAFYGAYHLAADKAVASMGTITLTRPFAKVRVVTTDLKELDKIGVSYPTAASIEYMVDVYNKFNALTGEVASDNNAVNAYNEFALNYTDATGEMTLFADYLFVPKTGSVTKFTLNVKDHVNKAFTTDIPVEANKLTTIKGEILTDGSDITVEIENGGYIGGEETYIYTGRQLIKAMQTSGQYALYGNIYVTENDLASTTRAINNITSIIDLNGYNITVNNKSGEALVTLTDDDTLVFAGEGSITATAGSEKLVEGENIYVTETDNVASEVVEAKDTDATLAYVLANGGTVTLKEDVNTANTLAVTTTNPVVINGNNKTITYTGSDRAFNVNGLDTANVTLNNLTFVNTASYCQRGINFNVAGKLTLNNVTVGKTGTPATYAINLPGSSDSAEVVINNSYFRGNIALNVWGENATINATGSEFVSYDGTEAENYAAIVLNNDGSTIANGTTIYIDGGKVIARDEKGEPSDAVSNPTLTGEVTISDSTEVVGTIEKPVAAVIYEGYNEFYSCTTLKAAINKAIETKGSVRLLCDTEVNETLEIKSSVVVNLNGKTVTFTGNRGFRIMNPDSNVTIENGKIVNTAAAGRCVETRNGNQTLTLENIVLEAKGTNSQTFTVGGSSDNVTVNINNSTVDAGLTGYGIMTFNPVQLTVDNSTVRGYAALYIKGQVSSLGSAGSEINVTNDSVLIGNNNTTAHESNTFETIVFEDNNVTLNIDESCTVKASTVNSNKQSILGFVGVENNTVTIAAENVVLEGESCDYLYGATGNTVKFNAKYADALKAKGYTVSEAVNGLVTVTE